MKYSKKDFSVGQMVWLLRSSIRNNFAVNSTVIEKVGNKFIYANGMKFDYDGYEQDEYNPEHELFLSQELAELEKKRLELGSKFRMLVHRVNAGKLTVEELETIVNILEKKM